MMEELLCKRCDVFVGYGAIGVVRVPEDHNNQWRLNHCWVCGRSRKEITEAQSEQTQL